jgi:c-di-GMP-binding flagellar brake protein YcgR
MPMSESKTETDPDIPHASAPEVGLPLAATLPQLASDDEFSKYLLHSHGEMVAVFRSLAEQVVQVTLVFNEGRDMVLSSLISYNADSLIFETGANAELNRRALQANKLFAVSFLDKVKIQFIVNGVTSVELNGRSAFRAPRPESLLRLQRRENYRLSTPLARPPKCKISFPTADGKAFQLEVDVADISGGGVCLAGLPASLPLAVGTELSTCSIDLPDVGMVAVKLQARNFRAALGRAGANTQRVGCQFIGLPGATATLIHRYIMKVERDRKARELGLG